MSNKCSCLFVAYAPPAEHLSAGGSPGPVNAAVQQAPKYSDGCTTFPNIRIDVAVPYIAPILD